MDLIWKAIYSDGTSLNQYNEKGEASGYKNIDRTKLRAFAIYKAEGEPNLKTGGFLVKSSELIYRLHLEPGKRLIFRRRGFKQMTSNMEVLSDKYFLMVGWQENVNGKNVQSITYIYPDGHFEQAGVWAGGTPELEKYEHD